MKKSDWFKMKKTQTYPLEILYEFFQAKNTKENISIEEFSQKFLKYNQMIGGVNTTKINEYFDQKLGITKLYDKNNQLIKEY